MKLGHVMNEIFSRIAWYTSTVFLQSTLDELDFKSAHNRNFTGLPICADPVTFSQANFRGFIAPVPLIVFFYIWEVFEIGSGWLKKRFTIPHSLWNVQLVI
jgi:hypothetical protein